MTLEVFTLLEWKFGDGQHDHHYKLWHISTQKPSKA